MLLVPGQPPLGGPALAGGARAASGARPQRRIGINENLAREILELHTLGVGGGYTQTDVTTFAEVLTGWSIGDDRGRFAAGEPGKFLFRAELHEPGAKRGAQHALSGQRLRTGRRRAARPGAPAARPRTSSPPSWCGTSSPTSRRRRRSGASPALSPRARATCPRVYRALIETREAWAQPLAKYKTPCDYILSAYRGLGLPVEAGRGPLAPFELLGQRTWSPGSPAGWPDRSADWDGASALMKRIEWADARRCAPRQQPRRAAARPASCWARP